MNHDLFDFFKEANQAIEAEYNRICMTISEDPGTAGDQGEENWKELIMQWLPSYFPVVTKGRILFDNGKTSPQIDVLILSPEYPPKLLGCKRYLASGVIAAFECKLTLKRQHLKELMETAKFIQNNSSNETGTARKDLQGRIYYGLLAHSHDWKGENSKPTDNIMNALIEYEQTYIESPIQSPDIICVADLAVWKSYKAIIPKMDDAPVERLKHSHVEAGFTEYDLGKNFEGRECTPVGMAIFSVLNHLSWEYKGLRDFVSYMRNISITGSGYIKSLRFGMDVLSEETFKRINTHGLANGGFYNEWRSVISF